MNHFGSGLLAAAASCLLLVGLQSNSGAVETRFWDVSSRGGFEAGESERIAIDEDDVLTLALGKRLLVESDELYVWDLCRGANEGLLAGTGDHGRVVRFEDGEAGVLADLELLEVMAVTVGRDGAVYAGGAGSGTVFVIADGGEVTPFFETGQGVVWDLAVAADGDLFIASGDSGRLYRVGSRGEGDVLYESTDPHIMCLAPAPDGGIFFGTAGEGLVGRVDPDGNARLLYDAEEEEVRDISLTSDGTVVFAVNTSPQGENGSPKPAVYRLDGRGSARKLLAVPSSYAFSLLTDRDGSVLVGTGDDAGLFRVDPETGRSARICQFDESQVLSIVASGSDLIVGTGDPARVYVIGPNLEENGEVTSDVRDAGAEAQWSRIRWTGDVPSGTSVRFETRSGNQGVVDATWSEWRATERDRDGSHVVDSPAARFFQWRMVLEGTGDVSPRVSQVVTSYREVNLAPELAALAISGKGAGFHSPDEGRSRSVRRELPGGVEVNYSLPMDPAALGPVSPAEAQWALGLRTVSWVATDPNGDQLTFDLYYRPVESERWLLLAEDLTDLVHTWDASVFPDGWYRIKVVASDESDNPDAAALQAERVSRPFEVDNTPPEVTRLDATLDGAECRVRAEARDARSPIVRAEVSLDGREWKPARAVSGLLDAKALTIDQRFPAQEREEGDPIVIRLFDETGNMVVSRAFLK